MKKINLSQVMLRISLICILSVALIRPYLSKILGTYSSTIIVSALSIVTILLGIMLKNNSKRTNKMYVFLSIIYLIPFFYNNAYFFDEKWTSFYCYIISIIYFILYYISCPSNDDINFALKYIILFAIATSIVSWIGFISPLFYVKHIVTLLPSGEMSSVLRSFPSANAGLTTHYSRNAFFISAGIISILYFFMNEKDKKKKIYDILLMLFMLTTLFLIGKRGHLLFLILSFIISYIIYKKIRPKTVVKLIFILALLGVFTYCITKFVPGANYVFERIIRKSNDADISTGRFSMYTDIIDMYKENGCIPIGWGQYASSTGYFHPGVHNDFLQLFCEVGVTGTIIIVGINILFLLKSIKGFRKTAHNLYFSIIMYNVFFITYSTTGIPHYDIEIYIIYLLMNSLAFLIYYNLEKEGNDYEKK